jgi:hypothetical protein
MTRRDKLMAREDDAVLTPEELEQQASTVLSGRGQENCGQASQRTIDDLHPIACREQLFATDGSIVSAARSGDQTFHRTGWHGPGITAEAHQPGRATRGADGRRIVECEIHLDEQVPGKERLDDLPPTPAPTLGCA